MKLASAVESLTRPSWTQSAPIGPKWQIGTQLQHIKKAVLELLHIVHTPRSQGYLLRFLSVVQVRSDLLATTITPCDMDYLTSEQLITIRGKFVSQSKVRNHGRARQVQMTFDDQVNLSSRMFSRMFSRVIPRVFLRVFLRVFPRVFKCLPVESKLHERSMSRVYCAIEARRSTSVRLQI